jgi:hypothetical protein
MVNIGFSAAVDDARSAETHGNRPRDIQYQHDHADATLDARIHPLGLKQNRDKQEIIVFLVG